MSDSEDIDGKDSTSCRAHRLLSRHPLIMVKQKRRRDGPHQFVLRHSHEMATAILPFFVIFVLGGNAAFVGLIEGSADGLASLFKSYSGYYSDKSGKRLPIIYLGYLATGILIPAIGFAANLAEVFLLRVGAWIGRGARGPPRDALLAESTSPSTIGKAFGFERALDSSGAVIGPAIALLLIPHLPFSNIFFVSAIPGTVCFMVVFLLVREVPRRTKGSSLKENERPILSFSTTVRTLPKEFRLLLLSVGLFGIANFSNVFFTLRAEQGTSTVAWTNAGFRVCRSPVCDLEHNLCRWMLSRRVLCRQNLQKKFACTRLLCVRTCLHRFDI